MHKEEDLKCNSKPFTYPKKKRDDTTESKLENFPSISEGNNNCNSWMFHTTELVKNRRQHFEDGIS